jgi:hypothetical protein
MTDNIVCPIKKNIIFAPLLSNRFSAGWRNTLPTLKILQKWI